MEASLHMARAQEGDLAENPEVCLGGNFTDIRIEDPLNCVPEISRIDLALRMRSS
jgi:hypothetical protein